MMIYQDFDTLTTYMIEHIIYVLGSIRAAESTIQGLKRVYG